MRIKDFLDNTEALFLEHAVPDARIDAEILVSELLKVPRLELFLHYQEILDNAQLEVLQNQVSLRCERVPLQHILKKAYFFESEFYVDENVLIPRFDTEVLCKEAIDLIGNNAVEVLDLCTGSACIAISIAKRCPNARISAIDISEKALAVAKKNAKLLGQSIDFLQNDLLDGITKQYDFIVSNPPYIASDEIPHLQEEVKKDPLLALDGGSTGLDLIQRIIKACAINLKTGGHLLLELGHEQSKEVVNLLGDFYDSKILEDYQGTPRFVVAKKKGE